MQVLKWSGLQATVIKTIWINEDDPLLSDTKYPYSIARKHGGGSLRNLLECRVVAEDSPDYIKPGRQDQ